VVGFYAERADTRWWKPLLAHCLTFLAWWRMMTASEIGITALVLWNAVRLIHVALWLLAMLPFALWRRLFLNHRPVVLTAVLVGCLASLAGSLTMLLWGSMAKGTCCLLAFLFHFPSIRFTASTQAPWILGTQSFQISVAPACAGYQGIGLMAVFVTA